jgi:DNA-binding FadR family transcriptional regulator
MRLLNFSGKAAKHKRERKMTQKLSDKIYEDMRRDIINGRYAIDSRLPTERDLAGNYGTNRFAIREAMTMLVSSGFAETRPQSGTYVKDFNSHCTLEMLAQIMLINRSVDPQTLKSIMKFREVNETRTAELAAARITEEDLAFLNNNLLEKEKNLGVPQKLAELDYSFHYRIILISNDIIIRLIFTSMKQVYIVFTGFFYSLAEAPENSLALNRTFLEQLSKRNPAKSREAMREIIAYGERRLHEVIAL